MSENPLRRCAVIQGADMDGRPSPPVDYPGASEVAATLPRFVGPPKSGSMPRRDFPIHAIEIAISGRAWPTPGGIASSTTAEVFPPIGRAIAEAMA